MTKKTDLTTRSLDEQYEQALAIDRQRTLGDVRAPNLFNWFLGMNCLVTGFVLILFSRLLEQFQTGRFAAWFMPLQATFILGGLGLLLSDLVERGSQVWKAVFRLVVAASYGALALIWLAGGDFDGVFIALWLALVVLLNVVADVSSFRSYLIFYQGLLVGLTVVFGFFPTLSGLRAILPAEAPGLAGGALVLVIAYVGLAWWSYHTNKRRSSILIGLASLPLAILAFFYASASDWVRSFIVLTTALFAFLLPFWDELKFRRGKHRQWVIRMFGVVLALFLVTVALIRILQNILITNTQLVLSDKVTYGRVFADATVNNTMSAIRSLADNELFKRALTRNQSADLTDLSRGFFESNRSLLRIVALDARGVIRSAYPLSEGLIGESLFDEDYFAKLMISELPIVSDVLAASPVAGNEPSVALAVPVIENDRVVGALIGFLNLRALADGLMEIATPASGEYFVALDRSGGWVVGPSELGGRRTGDVLVSGLMERGQARQGYSQDGVLTLAAEAQLSPTQWKLVLAQPLFAALAINQTGYIVVLALTSLSALIIGLTVLMERQAEDENK